MTTRRIRRSRRGLPPVGARIAAASTLTVLAAAGTALAFAGDLAIVSVTSSGGGANGASFTPRVSGDGRFVMFSSDAQNLVGGAGGRRQVYRRDMATGQVLLVSRANGAGGAPGTSTSYQDAAASRDGNRVVFGSEADNLSTVDDNGVQNIFLRDIASGQTILANRADGLDGVAAEFGSFHPAISADGRWVAFTSLSDAITAEDDDTSTDVFLRDTFLGRTYFVSRSAPGVTPAIGDSRWASVSGDGRYVAFESESPTLTPGEDHPGQDVFVYDRVTTGVSLVSRGPGGVADGPSGRPSISADGRFIAFESNANNLHPGDVEGDTDVFVRDQLTGQVTLASRADGFAGLPGDGGSTQPDISEDGRFVAFTSDANNLSAADRDDFTQDVFVRDLALHRTTLASRAQGPAGAAAGDSSDDPAISPEGRFVAFESDADNLGPQGNPAVRNVFLREVVGADAPPPPPPPPPGGGGTVTPPPPPVSTVGGPVISLSGGRLQAGRWRAGRLVGASFQGSLAVAGGPRGVRVTATVRGRPVVSVMRGLRNGVQPLRVSLPPSAPPGPYVVTITDLGSGVRLAPIFSRFVLPAPRQGIARTVVLTNTRGGTGRRKVLPASGPDMNAGFVFTALPVGTRRATISFRDPVGVVTTVPKPIVGRGVSAFISVRPKLRTGRWTITLSVRNQVVARTYVRIR